MTLICLLQKQIGYQEVQAFKCYWKNGICESEAEMVVYI
jgi:hypothetical protein